MFDLIFIVTYKGIDGNMYSTVVKEKNEYEAISKVSSLVNGNQNFGMNFKAEIHPTL